MAKLVSMKLDPAEAKKEAGVPVDATENLPQYPWGLTLNLDKQSLEKLGIKDEEEYEVGTECAITARGVVTGYSVNKRQGGEEYRCLDIQITDLALKPDEADAMRGPAADAMYPKK